MSDGLVREIVSTREYFFRLRVMEELAYKKYGMEQLIKDAEEFISKLTDEQLYCMQVKTLEVGKKQWEFGGEKVKGIWITNHIKAIVKENNIYVYLWSFFHIFANM